MAIPIGSHEIHAFVGPPEEYDLMGAMQFCLAYTFGLRAHHRLLDFGCGSLRAGRFLMMYLMPGHYFAIEPNKWLIREAVSSELGPEFLALRKPEFAYVEDFSVPFGVSFDFIIAQSILSHTGPTLTATALANMRGALAPNGLLLVTFCEGLGPQPEGWLYPGCIHYHRRQIAAFLRRAELHFIRLPWFHPRQVWYACSTNLARLPQRWALRYLHGAVLNVPEWDIRQQSLWRRFRRAYGMALPAWLRQVVLRLRNWR